MSFTDWANECTDEITAALASFINPVTLGTDPRNPFRRDPETEQIPFQLSLVADYNGTWYEQRLYLDPKSPPKGKQRAGFEVSTLQYVVQDIEEPSCITFKSGAVKGQKVKLTIGSTTHFKGVVSKVTRIAYHQYSDLSDRCRYQVDCVDETELFHRVPIFEIITSTTEFGMVADLCSRYAPELDISGINTALGDTITQRIIAGQYLDEIIQEVLSNNTDCTFWLDIGQDPSVIYMDKRSSPALLLPIEITDQNLYGDGNVSYPGFCSPGDWTLSPSEKLYRNSIIMRAPLLYNTGLADFSQGSAVVLGTSNLAGWYQKLHVGMRIRKTGEQSTYSLTDNFSTSAPIDDIRISPVYKEVNATGAAYEVIGDEFETLAEDSNEIARRASLRGEIGPNAGKVQVIIRIGTPLTEDEAERLAELYLRSEGWEGSFKTCSRKFGAFPAAGKVLRHNAPKHDAVADVPIAELDWAVQLGQTPLRGTEDAAWVTYNINFTDRAQYTDNALLQMLLRERKSKLRDWDKLTIQKGLGERYWIKDCLHGTEGFPIDEAVEDDDSMTITDISVIATSGPWYPHPGTPYGPPIIPIDPDDPSTYWEPT